MAEAAVAHVLTPAARSIAFVRVKIEDLGNRECLDAFNLVDSPPSQPNSTPPRFAPR